MYVIFKANGTQHKASLGQELVMSRISGHEVGSEVIFSDVVMMQDGTETKIGAPHLPHTHVVGQILKTFREDKILVFKKKRRKNYRRHQGFRADSVIVKIISISQDQKIK
jgi:large subunit ribosomal protein L21